MTAMNKNTNKNMQEEKNIKLDLNVKSSRYSKDDYAKMSDGMVP